MISQLPHFIQESLVHVSDLHLSRKSRSKLALLRNLHFYEVANKQIINFIDLQYSVLNKVENKLVNMVPASSEGGIQPSDILGSSFAWQGQQSGEVIIGKYIYLTKHDKKVYIMIQCWDVMVVIRKDCKGFTLQAEHEEVRCFKISRGKDYQVELVVTFNSTDQDVVTNFQLNELVSTPLSKADAYEKTHQRIKMKQSELIVHKIITKKQFLKLKSNDMFGSNVLRTHRLDEMQILSKCGDAWVKLTADDDIVLGVPLANNCSTHPTVLRNFRAVLHGSKDLDYKFSLYQLNTVVSERYSMQNFFESTEGDHNWCSWTKCAEFNLRPSAICVLVLRLKIHELFRLDVHQTPLFAFFDIIRSERTFRLKCFLSIVSFEGIFINDLCRINFQENHLQRDLLTVIVTSYNAEALIEYCSNNTLFEEYLCNKMGFLRILPTQMDSKIMQVDDEQEKIEVNSKIQRALFYNKNPNSIWHGTLLDMTNTSVSRSDVKIYTKTQEKMSVFFRVLNIELKVKCSIKKVHYDRHSLSTKLIEFEAALRDECNSYLKMLSSNAKKDQECAQMRLHLNALKVDMLFKNLDS